MHIHPNASESYEVLEGSLGVCEGRVENVQRGRQCDRGARRAHTFRNASTEVTRVRNVHQPALQFGEYFYRLDRVVNSGVVSSGGMTLRALMHLSILMTSYSAEIRPVRPPVAVMRAFAAVGRVLGYERVQKR